MLCIDLPGSCSPQPDLPWPPLLCLFHECFCQLLSGIYFIDPETWARAELAREPGQVFEQGCWRTSCQTHASGRTIKICFSIPLSPHFFYLALWQPPALTCSGIPHVLSVLLFLCSATCIDMPIPQHVRLAFLGQNQCERLPAVSCPGQSQPSGKGHPWMSCFVLELHSSICHTVSSSLPF